MASASKGTTTSCNWNSPVRGLQRELSLGQVGGTPQCCNWNSPVRGLMFFLPPQCGGFSFWQSARLRSVIDVFMAFCLWKGALLLLVRAVASTQRRNRGLVTRSGSQISRLTPLVWDDEWGGIWDVGCGVWEKTSLIGEGTKERLFRSGFVIKTLILHLVTPARRAFLSSPAFWCCPKSLPSSFQPSGRGSAACSLWL